MTCTAPPLGLLVPAHAAGGGATVGATVIGATVVAGGAVVSTMVVSTTLVATAVDEVGTVVLVVSPPMLVVLAFDDADDCVTSAPEIDFESLHDVASGPKAANDATATAARPVDERTGRVRCDMTCSLWWDRTCP